MDSKFEGHILEFRMVMNEEKEDEKRGRTVFMDG